MAGFWFIANSSEASLKRRTAGKQDTSGAMPEKFIHRSTAAKGPQARRRLSPDLCSDFEVDGGVDQ
jgi:hypothetical protein